MATRDKILPTREFDQGTVTATPDVRARMAQLLEETRACGLDIDALAGQCEKASRRTAESLVHELKEAVTILFLQWTRARQQKQKLRAFAIARVFNRLTYLARDLNERHSVVDTCHLQTLAAALSENRNQENFDPAAVCAAMGEAVKQHTHERAWPWVVLPTFARQPYGRILLLRIKLANSVTPIFVTQPFFLAGKCTLFHTHGQNWAFARPLGNGKNGNTHINTMWKPRSPDNPFPLVQTNYTTYSSNDTVVIPPRAIHGISRKRASTSDIPALADILGDRTLRQNLLEKTRFGELGCLHVYRPHLPLARELTDCPIVKTDRRFFIENDMIVFDHLARTIWSGAGGSWARRMIEFGTTGDHCGICFEDDPRRENLDPKLISKWCLADPPPGPIKFTSQSESKPTSC